MSLKSDRLEVGFSIYDVFLSLKIVLSLKTVHTLIQCCISFGSLLFAKVLVSGFQYTKG